jgi:hypothetical protein
MPALRRHPVALNGGGQPKSADDLAICPAIEHLRLATGIHREALAAALQHAEIVVVGVVLHHQHRDVPDLRKEIGSGRQGGPGTRAPPGGRPAAGQALHLVLFEQVPHVSSALSQV